MDLEQLRTFLVVIKHHGFSKAAGELQLTQSGISRQVSRLEKELGSVLIQRDTRNVELTFAGEQFRLYAENLLQQYTQFINKLKTLPATAVSELEIASSIEPGEFYVPGLVDRFAALHPGIKPEVFITDSSQVIEELKEGRWDLGFVGRMIHARGVQYNTVAEDEIVLAVPLAHPFACRDRIKLVELEDQPFIEPDLFKGTLRSVKKLLADSGMALPGYRVVTNINSTRAILAAVERGLGLGWVSCMALNSEWKDRVAIVRLEELSLHRQFYMARLKHRPLPFMAKAFADWVCRESKSITPDHEMSLKS